MRRLNFAAWLIAAFGLALPTASTAAAHPPEAYQRIEGYKHTGWGPDDGAPVSIRSLAQSADGFLWIASTDALYRFDGISFEKMPALSDPELGDYQPLVVHASPNGDVWIGYRPGAVALYRKGRLHDLHMPNPPEFVTTITEDGTGGMWVVNGRATHVLYRYKAGTWQDVGQALGVSGQIVQLFVDRQGVTWLAQPGKILYLPRGGQRFIATPAIVAPGIYRIGQGPDGRRWLIDQWGLRGLPDYPGGATDPAKRQVLQTRVNLRDSRSIEAVISGERTLPVAFSWSRRRASRTRTRGRIPHSTRRSMA